MIDQFPKLTSKYPLDVPYFYHVFSIRGTIALHIIESNSMTLIAGKPNGEDKAGRSIIDLQTPKEVVLRALDVADIFVTECENRGWMKSLDELDKVKNEEK